VAVEGPITGTKWSHIPLNNIEVDIKLVSFPYTEAMVITSHIDKWDVTRVLVDNGTYAEIWLWGGGRRIEPVGSVSLLVSFGGLQNA
jgi:hypothetical protein